MTEYMLVIRHKIRTYFDNQSCIVRSFRIRIPAAMEAVWDVTNGSIGDRISSHMGSEPRQVALVPDRQLIVYGLEAIGKQTWKN